MKIVFADKRINEYKNGEFHAINDGKPIDAPELLVSDLLAATVHLEGEEINVFVPAKKQDEVPAEEAATDYPEGFPFADVLQKNGYTHADAIALSREQLVELKGIGEKSADAILAFHNEK